MVRPAMRSIVRRRACLALLTMRIKRRVTRISCRARGARSKCPAARGWSGATMHVVGAAVSPSLLDTLERFQEVWHDWYGDPIVDVVAEEERERDARPAVSVSTFSGGVDSVVHRVPAHARSRAARSQSPGRGHDPRRRHPAGQPRRVHPRLRSVASAWSRAPGSSFVTVQTNVWEVVETRAYPIGAGLSSVLHLLGGRFGTGLIPGTTSYRHLVFPLGSSPVSDGLLGSRNFEVVHDGAVDERFDKLRHLANWDEALDLLRVCLADPQHHRNCGHCQKCMLAILSLPGARRHAEMLRDAPVRGRDPRVGADAHESSRVRAGSGDARRAKRPREGSTTRGCARSDGRSRSNAPSSRSVRWPRSGPAERQPPTAG